MEQKILLIVFLFFLLSVSAFAQNDAKVTPNATVAQDGSGTYRTMKEAISAVPDNNKSWFVILVKNGSYKEKLNIPETKSFVKIVGESTDKTVLTYDDCSSKAGGTGKSASVTISASDFIAQNITFENSFDYVNSKLPNKQAVALMTNADRQIYSNCRFLGNQDTLYVQGGRQYFKDSYIEGLVDFIFGNATAVFENCQVHSLYNLDQSVTAPSTLEETKYGLVFFNCKFTGDEKFKDKSIVYIGRPWHPSSVKVPVKSSTILMNCELGSFINAFGWTDMGGVLPKTERFFEYKSVGPGTKKSKYRPQLNDFEAKKITSANIFSSYKNVTDNWDPEILLGK